MFRVVGVVLIAHRPFAAFDKPGHWVVVGIFLGGDFGAEVDSVFGLDNFAYLLSAAVDLGLVFRVLRGDLERIEEEPGALGVDAIVGDGVGDFAERALDGAAVLKQGNLDGLPMVDVTFGVGAGAGVEVAEPLVLEGRGPGIWCLRP